MCRVQHLQRAFGRAKLEAEVQNMDARVGLTAKNCIDNSRPERALRSRKSSS